MHNLNFAAFDRYLISDDGIILGCFWAAGSGSIIAILACSRAVAARVSISISISISIAAPIAIAPPIAIAAPISIAAPIAIAAPVAIATPIAIATPVAAVLCKSRSEWRSMIMAEIDNARRDSDQAHRDSEENNSTKPT